MPKKNDENPQTIVAVSSADDDKVVKKIHVRHRKWQTFDEIHLTTVPRYKTGNNSGGEWRISCKVEWKKKGKVIATSSYNKIASALLFLASEHDGELSMEKHNETIDAAKDLCDQEPCAQKATVFYELKKRYCDTCAHQDDSYFPVYRRFCSRHATRGDAGFEDSDGNYLRLDHNPETGEEVEMFALEEIPEEDVSKAGLLIIGGDV